MVLNVVKWIQNNKIKSLLGVVILLYLLLLTTNTKILLSETKVEPGQDYVVEDWGNLGDASQASLACKYFNGRNILTRVF